MKTPNQQGNDMFVSPRATVYYWGVGYETHFVGTVKKVLEAEYKGKVPTYKPIPRGKIIILPVTPNILFLLAIFFFPTIVLIFW